MTDDELKVHVLKAIRTTISKFRQQPEFFFTESDLHSYCYSQILNGKLLIRRVGSRNVFQLHREYPTNFRYSKQALLLPNYSLPELDSREGSRGHYDLAVLTEEFAQKGTFADVRNKDIEDLRSRKNANNAIGNELLFAIEFKFVFRDSATYVAEVIKDNRKLVFARKHQAKYAINLVFCDDDSTFRNLENLKKEVKNADKTILSLFIRRSTYRDGSRKPADGLVGNHECWSRWFKGFHNNPVPEDWM